MQGCGFCALLNLYFKTTYHNIRPHFQGYMGGLKMDKPLYYTTLYHMYIMVYRMKVAYNVFGMFGVAGSQ